MFFNRRGDSLQDAHKAEIYSRKNYLNGLYEKGSKLDIGKGEEEFPTSFPEKIPVLGSLFKASEVAYTSGAASTGYTWTAASYALTLNTYVKALKKVWIGDNEYTQRDYNTLINISSGYYYAKKGRNVIVFPSAVLSAASHSSSVGSRLPLQAAKARPSSRLI